MPSDAVSSDGTLYVADEKKGRLLELGAAGARVLAERLKKPGGLAWDDAGHLLVLAEKLAGEEHARGLYCGSTSARGPVRRYQQLA